MRVRLLLGAVLLLFCGVESAEAQYFGGVTTGSGTFGSRTLGGGIAGRGGTQFGRGGGQGIQNQANVGQITGTERFVREARQPGQFVGTDTADLRNPFSQAQGANLGSAIDQLRGQQQFRGQQQRQATQPQMDQNIRSPVRPRLTIGFDAPAVDAVALSATATDRLARISQLRVITPVEVEVHQGVARLTGIVPSEHDRALAARLVLLEPGIAGVQNDLLVIAPERLDPPPGQSVPAAEPLPVP